MNEPLLKRVSATIAKDRLVGPGDTVIVAVSGGADSVALLDILSRLTSLRLRLVVAHLNHALRGEEGDGDESFVRELAARYGAEVVTRRVEVASLARLRKLSIEEAGREARYAFFADVAARYGAATTALGHHRDDQAETLLLRLLRGAAGSGLCGMSTSSPDGRYIRPLLAVSRSEVEAYLHARDLSFRTDSSNTDTSFLRNRIRHHLIPLLGDYNPQISRLLAGTATALGEDEGLLATLCEAAFLRLADVSQGTVSFAVSSLAGEPKGLRFRLYRAALLRVRGSLARISNRHLDDTDSLLCSRRPHASLSLPGETTVSRCYDLLRFGLGTPDNEAAPYAFTVEGPGKYPLPDGRVIKVVVSSPPDTAVSEGERSCASFDLDLAPFPWQVRTFRPGDRFVPAGMKGHKKLKDFFIDAKVPVEVRRRTPLVESGSSIIWAGGLRQSEDSRVSAGTRQVVIAEILDFTH